MSRTREEYDKLIALLDTIKKLEAEKKELIDFIEKVYDKVGTAWEYDKAFLEIIKKYNPDNKYFPKL
jgi:uncharacterized protein (UPF0335 family)